MNQIYMTQTEIRRALNDIPRGEDINIALCELMPVQRFGRNTWELHEAARAIVKSYRRRAADNWRQHKTLRAPSARVSVYVTRARAWVYKANAIDDILMRLEAAEKEASV